MDLDVDRDLARLDALLEEVHELARSDSDRPRLVHALRNLGHLAGLLASCLAAPDIVKLPKDTDRASA